MATMSTVWDRAAEFLSGHLAAVVPLALAALFVPQALSGTLGPVMGTLGGGGDLALGVLLVLLALVTVWGNIAITALALDPSAGRAPAVVAANRLLLPLAGLYLLLLVGLLLLASPFFVALGLSGVDLTAMAAGRTAGAKPNAGAALFMLLYLPVFTVLLLWLSARLSVMIPTMVIERRGLGTLARSFALTRPAQWKIVGVLILYVLVSLVATRAAQSVVGSILALTIGGQGPLALAGVLTATIVAGVSTVFSLLAIAFVARLYLAARDAREAIVEGAVAGAVVGGAGERA